MQSKLKHIQNSVINVFTHLHIPVFPAGGANSFTLIPASSPKHLQSNWTSWRRLHANTSHATYVR